MGNVLGAENSSYEHFKVELEADRLLFIPQYPPLVVDEELNKKLYNALAFKLYPYFTVLAQIGVDIVAIRNKDYSTERALALRFAVFHSVCILMIIKTTTRNFRVPVMENYKINFELETSIRSVSWVRWVLGKSTFVNCDWMFITAGADLHVIDEKLMNYQN